MCSGSGEEASEGGGKKGTGHLYRKGLVKAGEGGRWTVPHVQDGTEAWLGWRERTTPESQKEYRVIVQPPTKSTETMEKSSVSVGIWKVWEKDAHRFL